MQYFSADWHLDHKNIIKYCNRPFSFIEKMNETILHNFFTTVKVGDTFYFLGDLSFSSTIFIKFIQNCVDKKLALF